MPLFVKRVMPDAAILAPLAEALDLFEARVQKIVYEYKAKCLENAYVETEWVDHVEFSDEITGSN